MIPIMCVRTKPEWAKSVLSLISLSGGLYMLSDTEDAYTEEKLDIIRKTLPPLPSVTAETGPLNMDFPAYTWTKLHGFAVQSHETPVEMEDVNLKEAYDMAGIYPTMEDDHPFSTLWSFHLEHAGENWTVMGRFATVPLEASSVGLDQIDLDPEGEYHAFDFWKQEYLGIISGEIKCPALELGCCQIIGLRRAQKVPQFLASSRHVSMDAVSVENLKWDTGILTVELAGAPGMDLVYYFAVPDGYDFCTAEVSGGTCSCRIERKILAVDVVFEENQAVLKLKF